MEERILKALEALRKASKEVEAADDGGCDSPSMRALLELEMGSIDLLSGDPLLSTLSSLLSHLKTLACSLRSGGNGGGGGGGGILRSFLRGRRSSEHEALSRVAGSIGSEIQSWIDRECVDRLVSALRSRSGDEEPDLEVLLLDLASRAAQGFDRGLQDALLRAGAFAALESVLNDPTASKRVRERCAAAVLSLVRFNKDVFVGPVLMGPTVASLVSSSSSSPSSLRAINGLIAAIRSPLIDEIQSRGEIPKLVALLASPDLEIRVLALDLTLEIGYYGRKEAVDAMLADGLIERLVSLQLSELGGALIEIDGWDSDEPSGDGIRAGVLGKPKRGESTERRFLESRPFASAVARFAIQVEVGEGLRQREKQETKQEILRRVREAVIPPAENATIMAEVLWGSTP